jgi:uncharacterized cupin superfamily protein
MIRPSIANLDELEFDDIEENGRYTSRRACFSQSIGARDLGYNLTVLPPGKVQCPFHNHRGEEEMFLILEGTGTLRFGDREYPIRPRDVIACPTGGPEVAHQIANTGDVDLVYLAVSTVRELEACEYPDSGKVLVSSRTQDSPRLGLLFRKREAVGYYDGEDGTPDA